MAQIQGTGRFMIEPRRILLGGIAAFALSGAAMAADVPMRGPVYTKAAPSAFSWDGWYVGVHGGYAWGDFDSVVNTVVAGSTKPDGFFGGLQIGYLRHITPNWVLGFEADISAGGVSGNGVVGGVFPTVLDIDYFGTARTRLGYAVGPWLFYGTGGVAWAKTDFRLLPPAAPIGSNFPHIGWTAGAGIEYAFSRNWSAKIEYLYADLGETRSVVAAANQINDLTLSTVRLGLNYRFGEVRALPTHAAFPTKGPVAAPFTWTGVYVGLHAGYGWGDQDYSVPAAALAVSTEPSGAFGGFQSGVNWQFARNWVIGIEADSSFGSIEDTVAGGTVKTDSLGTVRGRLGYAVDRLLFYGTGGVAWAHNESSYGAGVFSNDRFFLGWAAGAGIEYAISPRWSAKLEYIHMDFSDNVHVFGAGTVATEGLSLDTVRFGINYRASLFDLVFGR
jgi:outer membrane immunogenic protein